MLALELRKRQYRWRGAAFFISAKTFSCRLYKKGKSVFVVKTVRARWKYVIINTEKRRERCAKCLLKKKDKKVLYLK